MTRDLDRQPNFSAVELGRSDCLELLRGARIGRVVLSIGCIPVALPVNISVDDDDVIFSTDSGSKLTAAIKAQVVSVEVDDIDPLYRTGWSVLVTGKAQLVTELADIERAKSRLQAWAPGPHPFLIKVPSTLISGRRLLWGPLTDSAVSVTDRPQADPLTGGGAVGAVAPRP
jgi:nitroimidazol reductase NimA-like FMN-containing flavoprotein (pyridoxamine 5'-phosphate oxidase superfamily)